MGDAPPPPEPWTSCCWHQQAKQTVWRPFFRATGEDLVGIKSSSLNLNVLTLAKPTDCLEPQAAGMLTPLQLFRVVDLILGSLSAMHRPRQYSGTGRSGRRVTDGAASDDTQLREGGRSRGDSAPRAIHLAVPRAGCTAEPAAMVVSEARLFHDDGRKTV